MQGCEAGQSAACSRHNWKCLLGVPQVLPASDLPVTSQEPRRKVRLVIPQASTPDPEGSVSCPTQQTKAEAGPRAGGLASHPLRRQVGK